MANTCKTKTTFVHVIKEMFSFTIDILLIKDHNRKTKMLSCIKTTSCAIY